VKGRGRGRREKGQGQGKTRGGHTNTQIRIIGRGLVARITNASVRAVNVLAVSVPSITTVYIGTLVDI
jgi:hypothetical protein